MHSFYLPTRHSWMKQKNENKYSNRRFTFRRLSVPQTFSSADIQLRRLSVPQTFSSADIQLRRHSAPQTFRSADFPFRRLSVPQTFRSADFQLRSRTAKTQRPQTWIGQQDPRDQRMPGSLTSIPLSAIFSASRFGATSNAVSRVIIFFSTSCFSESVKSCIPSW